MSQTDITAERLKSLIERIERLETEKKGISDDIKDVFAEASGTGYDVKIMRQVLKLRKLAAAEREEQQELIDTYMHNLGMIAGARQNAA